MSIAMEELDLGAVDDLCRLVVVARRLGCTVTLTGASDELRELLELAGVSGVVLDERADPGPDETDLR